MGSKKTTLYWGVVREPYGDSFTVMRVTSENRHAVFGSIFDRPTHCRSDRVYARHQTEEAAASRIEAVRKIAADYAPRIREARRQLDTLEHDKHAAMVAAAEET